MASAPRHFALSAIGRDRPGIVAAITRDLLAHAVNVEDSQMAILRGHFTMMLVLAAADDVDADALAADLDRTRAELELEALSLSEVPEVSASEASTPSHIVTAYGADHPGILHAVAAALAELGVNVTDLTTRLVGDDEGQPLYVIVVEVAIPPGSSATCIEDALAGVAREQGIDVTVRELERDTL